MSEDTGRLVGGRYRLGDVLGRGGMGTVWRGQDEILGRTVAVKELRFPSSVDEDEKQRLITRTLREAKAIARIRSGSAVTVFDVVNEDSRPWIVMELIEGRSLADHIKEDGPLSAERAAEVGLAILDVLRAAHREGILHRDVKPSNVLLEDNTGRVILTDFGIAKVEGDPSVTSTGMLVGAPSYISPERARGKPPGPPADLWSLGGLLFAAVEGRPPYDKGSAISTLTAVMTEPVPHSERAGELSEVISGLLVKDPEKRLDVESARVLLEPVAFGFKSAAAGTGGGSDATRTAVLPTPGTGTPPSGPAGTPGGEGGGRRKRRAESGSSADRLRGALKSVRNAAGSAAAGATGTSSSGAGTGAGGADASGGAGTGTRKPKDSRGSGGSRGRTAGGGTQRKGSGAAGAGAGGAGAAASSGARHSLTKPTAPSRPSTPPTAPPAPTSPPRASSGASGASGAPGPSTSAAGPPSPAASRELPAEGDGAARTGSGKSGSGAGTGAGAGPGTGGGSGSRALPPESGGSGAITSLRDLRELPELRQGISRRMLGLIAAAVVIAVIVVVAVVATASGGEGGGDEAKNGGSSSGSAGGDAKGGKGGKPAEGEQGEGGSDGKDDKPEQPQKPGEGDDKGEKDGEDGKGKGGKDALPAGYKTVSDGRFHFSMAMPEGFERTGVAGKNSGGKYSGGGLPKIQVDFNDSPLANAAGAWRSLEPAVKGSSPGYRPLGIKKTEWRGYPTVADWQFLRQEDGQKVHVLNRGFKVDGKRGYAIMITCKADGWQDKKCATLRKTAFKTFKPTG
ncbi:hypothetical protein GCM10009801_29990 [Streptomyces albiaxialis]|uniref:non-specific serine/threonine protein kinase n=1 Tax=Streptomyces albiaxialis TaxID=329523 RepID=A0ABN2VX79_9ACTN